ncbi:hypothetical protein, partial [Vibrio parahaemolyticus]|uniref:hypothetical protein n=1 Tax=Vibrio parahaemolyticus TaxID=670 RepID=UPI001BAFBC8F
LTPDPRTLLVGSASVRLLSAGAFLLFKQYKRIVKAFVTCQYDVFLTNYSHSIFSDPLYDHVCD